MFSLDESYKYYVYPLPVNMGNGIDGLYNIICSNTPFRPSEKSVFVFFSKNRKMVKILKMEADGFVLYQKRLNSGLTFMLPKLNPETDCMEMDWDLFYMIMRGVTIKAFRPMVQNYRILQEKSVLF